MALRKKKQIPTRRSSSLSGESVQTYSYRHSRSERSDSLGRSINSSGPKSPKSLKTTKLEKLAPVVIAVVLIVVLISVVYLSGSADVKVVGGSTNSIFLKPEPAVKTEADKLLSSSILNSNKLTVDASKIRSTLETDFPMYSSVDVTLPFISNHLVINLTPAKPAVLLSNTSGSYLLSENGQIMINSTNPTNFANLKLPDVTYPVNSFLSTGDQLLTTSEVQFIQIIGYELQAKGVIVASMKLPEGTSEIDVYITGKPYFVKFNLQNDDPRQQVGSFLAAQHYLEGQGITPSQYIDVRVDGRVYYQ